MRRKADALKLVSGSPSTPRQPKTAPARQHESVKLQPPAFLVPEARREFRRLAKELDGAGILHALDRNLLAAYAQTFARWREAEEAMRNEPLLAKTKAGIRYTSPLLGTCNTLQKLLHTFARELGLEPTCRQTLHAVPRSKSRDERYF